jgi:pilus assembly protein CpaE
MQTRILVIDADAGVQKLTTQTLRSQGCEVIVAHDAATGLQLWRRERPDLILLDFALSDAGGHKVAATIRSEESPAHVPIIMLTARDEVAARVEVFRSGADAYLTKPVHPGELVARVRGMLARFGSASTGGSALSGRVVAFYGAKGGVGTTTLAINAAIAFRRELHRRVALVDGRLQFGDHRIFLDLGLDRKTIIDVITAPSFDMDLLRSVLIEHDSGVDLLLSPPTPEGADRVRPDDLPKILSLLRTQYDYVIVDVESRLDEATLHVLDTADTVMVVMTPDLPSVKDVRMLLETVGHLGWEDDKISLVLNRSTSATGINMKSVETALERSIDFAILSDYRTAISAINTGAPFMTGNPGSSLSRALIEFVKGIESRSDERRSVLQLPSPDMRTAGAAPEPPKARASRSR